MVRCEGLKLEIKSGCKNAMAREGRGVAPTC